MNILLAQQVSMGVAAIALLFVWFRLLRSGKKISKIYNSPKYIWSILDIFGRASLVIGVVALAAAIAVRLSW